jgi:hypothetical protein
MVHKRRYTEDAAPVSGSFFHDALLKWKVTDLSAAFNAFYREVRGISQSLELVLVNKVSELCFNCHFLRLDV